MNDTIDTLASYDSDNDPLQDLIRRVEQMENSDAGGYGACIKFYKRIIARMEGDKDAVYEMLIDAKDQAARAEEVISEWFLEPTGVFAEDALRDVQNRLVHLIDTLETHLKQFDD